MLYDRGVLVFLAAKSGLIKDVSQAAQYQDFIICVEMLIAAIGHLYAFPYREYAVANVGGSYDFIESLAHAVKLNDLYHDTLHQFAPTYHEYVLYNHTEGEEGATKYNSQTSMPTDLEMEAVRKNNQMFGNKLDGVELSCSSGTSSPNNDGIMPDSTSSQAPQSSLLIDTLDSFSVSHDMSFIDLNSYPTEVPAVNEEGKR
ncbi:hypothetical protein SAY86_023786 [Trapa natans]|uniref:Uncharacterized protein n=1 Tax=Trapa natans TaxID=22666 RepID=A0AAN7RAJ5_TRANT|nr:hypothetical protein SAY86_023786 [Trapa natans]